MNILVVGKLQVNLDAVASMSEQELDEFYKTLTDEQVKSIKKALKSK
jgi:mRNA-degrading endonuclease toxin of MazEF toxin-antitoxin module